MKKIISFLAALAMVFGTGAALPEGAVKLGSDIVANAETYGDFGYEVLDDGTVEITGYTGDDTKVSIPSTINGKKVTSIGSNAFEFCTSLENIIIPDGVTSIGYEAFVSCNSLTDIVIPKSVTSIAEYAFDNTPWLKAQREKNPLVIVNSILIDGRKCSGDVVIPSSVTSIAEGAFYLCHDMSSVMIPDSVTTIGDFAFEYTGLKSVSIPEKVTSIGDGTFSNCTSLENLIIPSSVTSISSGAFDNTPWLKAQQEKNPLVIINNILIDGTCCEGKVVIPDDVTSICDSAFYGCKKLVSITIPGSVMIIGNNAFENCTALTDVKISYGVKSIGNHAFCECMGLTGITIPDSVTSTVN